jgi:hypothetical protein
MAGTKGKMRFRTENKELVVEKLGGSLPKAAKVLQLKSVFHLCNVLNGKTFASNQLAYNIYSAISAQYERQGIKLEYDKNYFFESM